jgi:hypothetical protein
MRRRCGPDAAPHPSTRGPEHVMSGIGRRTRSGLFALATAAALAFGGAQAFASPGPAAAERACSGGQCNRDCRARGADGGFCDQGGCICYIQVDPIG